MPTGPGANAPMLMSPLMTNWPAGSTTVTIWGLPENAIWKSVSPVLVPV